MIKQRILYQDSEIVILNKPGGLLSVPGLYDKDSAFGRLQALLGELHIVHRLDRDTSGIIVYARNKPALTCIQQQFEKQTTRKVYEALVSGEPKGSGGCINLPIIVDWPNRPLQKISHTDGRYALTRWHKLDVDTDTEGRRTTRIEMYPKTGRSHQLRLHMQQIGHPIIGDPFYSANYSEQTTPTMQLHARELSFRHPTTDERMDIVSPPPF
ncbi:MULTISPECIES: RluA family pseudouridine synthase [Oceanospirillaceae]|jgi:tRNA pseudouridine32 synthase/23S rRNA pseudouridine746 synthase|uniref:RluA family pseudouridine synthase n=1 Tax=Oceanobacter antarcticus TaxID=3133425 RepID=A0ABW8NHT0_9GAMM|tara:strand:- start:14648 stop:15283 length:636 start_codon:yes stop_codon:yes gene_type:complete